MRASLAVAVVVVGLCPCGAWAASDYSSGAAPIPNIGVNVVRMVQDRVGAVGIWRALRSRA